MNAMQLTPERKETLRQYWQEKSLSELMDFIVAHYHARAARLVSQIVAEIDILDREASCTPKDLSTALQHLRTMLTDDLAQHTREEEDLLFPYIRSLETGAGANGSLRSLGRIHDEHDQIMDSLVRLKVQSTLCRLPEEACAHCRSLHDGLAVLLVDLQEHTFLEDEVLFLEALDLEKRGR
jgi:regulator of cell morphogenesis and NO signaling